MNQLKGISAYLSGLLSIFSLPQRKQFLGYLAGLIWIIRFRSMKEIASQLERKTGDGLHHFIKNSPCEPETIILTKAKHLYWTIHPARGKGLK